MPPSPSARPDPDILRVFQSREQTRLFYNKISRAYDLLSERSEAPARNAGLALLAAGPGESVLEIGFGTGHCLAALADAVGPEGRVCGLDLSDQMLKQARLNLAKAGVLKRVTLRRGDATALPFADGGLDAVFMSFTLELFDTPEIPRVLGECLRALRPGGRVVVVGMSKEGSGGAVVKMFEWGHRHFPNFLDCRPIYVRAAMERAGFKIQKALRKRMWVPVEVVLGFKPERPPPARKVRNPG
jgi:demethylmenaquinone methyltransferase/2-methoxy-6-polyprenyl-1,4-benzoquinol methylase